MILIDVNLLLVASIEEADGHADGHRWLAQRLSGCAQVGLPWAVLTGFIRIAAQPRIWERPVPFETSLAIVRAWLSRPNAWTPEPGPAHLDILQRLLVPGGSPRHVTDAHLAAIAIEHGLIVCTLDHDFARWEPAKLRWENPLRH
ncbi:MAG: hypothetical protein AVDCRST_MAG53-3483 [uncultured Solirubrobacteraceae bacterium]|uniref:Ribonuclease VapC n=1 Tax=uncultured Solirubrobacteraceae bacterium TaxID=1162706 RepID=A0A6J4TD03_9ACTN|nr:MAG: hypothetical protein AVDCRST_MAG53-3483 [uncultured Solirubrobacteraceae bacterium]